MFFFLHHCRFNLQRGRTNLAAKDHMSTPAEAEEMQRLGEVSDCFGHELAARNKLIGRILDDGIYKCKLGKTTPKPPDIEPSTH